jgi:hypothetical protein
MTKRASKREVSAIGVTDLLLGKYIYTQSSKRYGKVITAKIRENIEPTQGEIALLLALRPRKVKGIQGEDFFTTFFVKV